MRALVLDIDNTLTPPRRDLEQDMATALKSLRVPFALAAGSDLPLIERQFLGPLHGYGYRGDFDGFLCNGAIRYRCRLGDELIVERTREFSIKAHLGSEEFEKLVSRLNSMLDAPEYRLPPPMRVLGSRLIDRLSMLNLVPIGRPPGALSDEAYKNRDAFAEFDRRSGFRQRLMADLQSELRPLIEGKDLVITLGGETSFDIVVRGNDKRFSVKTLLAEGFTEIIYLGDALFAGGNDASILEFIEEWGDDCPVRAIRVDGPADTLRQFSELGLLPRKA